ncbi:MAG: PaaI family thioesterase [Chloroflexi bacterium]|nr:PaaI family thioesterase [Chloroflexota bacterium]
MAAEGGAAEERKSSPFVELIGGQVEEWSEGYVRMSLVLERHHTNPNGVMHGGVITTLMDEVLGGAIASLRGIEVMYAAPHATVEMNASFLLGARPGDKIVVEGRVLRLGKRVAFGEAEAHRAGRSADARPDGELIAKGRMTFVILSRSE